MQSGSLPSSARLPSRALHAVVEVLRTIIQALREVLGKPTSTVLLDKYAKLCLVVDEVLNEVSLLHMPPGL